MTAPRFWKPLSDCRDTSIPKLMNLRLAKQAHLRVPETFWVPAVAITDRKIDPPLCFLTWPLIVRSASPTEDTKTTSNAGQLYSEVVLLIDDFDSATRRVVAALPVDQSDKPRGAVFVQPVCSGSKGAGIAFFDGFYYERTLAAGENTALTSGLARGKVVRGTVQRGDAWSDWLASIWLVFYTESYGVTCLDVEFVHDDEGYVLLQVRPALFPLKRNECLSLANHKEILGDPPSPWIVSVLVSAGQQALQFFAAADPAVLSWNEAYAVEVAGRAWMNVGFFFRLMDLWGLPRTMVLEGIGGKPDSAADSCWLPKRALRSVPKLLKLQWAGIRAIVGAERGFEALDRRLAEAHGIKSLYETNVALMAFALRTNFAINGALTAVIRFRRHLRIPGSAEIVTQKMMTEYDSISSTDGTNTLDVSLDDWLVRYGHRGPLESDPARPRFAEMRDILLADLALRLPPRYTPPVSSHHSAFWRFFFWLDERREWFRDSLMRRWQILRARLLKEAEQLAAEDKLTAVEDVFYLQAVDLNDASALKSAVNRNRQLFEKHCALSMPLAATREEILAIVEDQSGTVSRNVTSDRRFAGIALGEAIVDGRVVKADSLLDLLARSNANPGLLTHEAILVVPCLEPSWAIVFPRVGGVAAEIGGELSHAAILLREARRPAIVNCAGLYAAVNEGDRVRLDGVSQCVQFI